MLRREAGRSIRVKMNRVLCSARQWTEPLCLCFFFFRTCHSAACEERFGSRKRLCKAICRCCTEPLFKSSPLGPIMHGDTSGSPFVTAISRQWPHPLWTKGRKSMKDTKREEGILQSGADVQGKVHIWAASIHNYWGKRRKFFPDPQLGYLPKLAMTGPDCCL